MPMYEFDCPSCGERFEELVPAGTGSTPCPACATEETERAFSAPAAAWKLVKTPGAARQQQIRNASLHSETKTRFKETRRKHREAKRAKGGGGRGGPSGGGA